MCDLNMNMENAVLKDRRAEYCIRVGQVRHGRISRAAMVLIIVVILIISYGCQRGASEVFENCWGEKIPEGATRLPNGRVVFPAGLQIPVNGFPQSLALTPDGRTLIGTLNGFGRFYSHSLVSVDTSTGSVDYLWFRTLFFGVAVSQDGRAAYASGGGDNVVYALNVGPGGISLKGSIPVAGFPAGLTVSPTGEVVVACSQDNTLKIISPATMAVSVTIPVGKNPWSVIGDREGNKVYVTNRGDGTVTSISYKTSIIKTITLGVNDHPSSIAIAPDGERVYVSNADSDTIASIAGVPDLLEVFYDIRPSPEGQYGSIPAALALSDDAEKLYVALAGENAVAVYSTSDMTLLGKIPAGWYPSAVVLSPDGKRLYVANAKGKTMAPLFPEMTGSISFVDISEGPELRRGIQRVAQNNCLGGYTAGDTAGMNDVRYVVVIEREGKTYDAFLGDMGASAFGDPTKVRFPREVVPNVHALAETYAVAPFFFADGEAPAQNRQWRYSAYAGDFLERTWPSSYGPHMRTPDDLSPIAQSPAGTIFESVIQHGLAVKIYGEVLPESLVLQKFTSTTYANAISDVARANVFISDLKSYVTNGNLPRLIYVFLPPQCPDLSFPCSQDSAYMKEEDRATGMIVETLSKSPYWGDMAVFLVETSPPVDANDSVDGHRTGCLLISPYARRGYISARHYSIPGLLRTIETILKVPPLTQYDGNARVLNDLFSEEFSPAPYVAVIP